MRDACGSRDMPSEKFRHKGIYVGEMWPVSEGRKSVGADYGVDLGLRLFLDF